jgi:hypothetical protein
VEAADAAESAPERERASPYFFGADAFNSRVRQAVSTPRLADLELRPVGSPRLEGEVYPPSNDWKYSEGDTA